MASLRYPIRAVAKMTGLSLDTLRAWERRYQAVVPERGPRGRMYTEDDVQRLRLLRDAVARGHAIGHAAKLSDRQLKQVTQDSSPSGASEVPELHRLDAAHLDLGRVIAAVERFDCSEADLELGRLAALLPPRTLVHQVALPLMRSVGQMWHDGRLTVAQEHLVSAILSSLLASLVRLYAARDASLKLIFATPSGELHEFGILTSAMLAAGGGLGVVYLGANLPAEEILWAAERNAPRAVVLGLTGTNGNANRASQVRKILKGLPGETELWLGGGDVASLFRSIKSPRVYLMENFETFERHLQRLGGRIS